MKAYAAVFSVSKIGVSSKEAYIEFSAVSALADKRLNAAMDKFAGYIQVSMTNSPRINFAIRKNPARTMQEMTKFLKFAASFT